MHVLFLSSSCFSLHDILMNCLMVAITLGCVMWPSCGDGQQARPITSLYCLQMPDHRTTLLCVFLSFPFLSHYGQFKKCHWRYHRLITNLVWEDDIETTQELRTLPPVTIYTKATIRIVSKHRTFFQVDSSVEYFPLSSKYISADWVSLRTKRKCRQS